MNFIVIQKQVYQKEIIKKMIWNKICYIFAIHFKLLQYE